MPSDDLLNIQTAHNSQTRNNWERCKSHREKLTALICDGSTKARLRIFGAGNCNDIDLTQLTTHFTNIELVDIDQAALDHAIDYQKISDKHGVACTSEVDLSNHDYKTDHLADVTVSSCLFSQLIEQLPVAELRNAEFVAEYRRQHLNMLLETTTPGGTVLFVSDMVSNLTIPGLGRAKPNQLNGILSHAIEKKNFFTGTNPFSIEQQLNQMESVKSHQLHDAWLWKLGARTFAVYAFSIMNA